MTDQHMAAMIANRNATSIDPDMKPTRDAAYIMQRAGDYLYLQIPEPTIGSGLQAIHTPLAEAVNVMDTLRTDMEDASWTACEEYNNDLVDQ
jgi:hypothetical protein